MNRTTRWAVVGLGVAATAGVAAGVAWAAPTAGDDEPLTGQTLERAGAAALAATGGGEVVDSEVEDGNAAYSVEVRTDDGRQIEVDLNDAFEVIGQERDDDDSEGVDDDSGGIGDD